jgi:hypothetical protein
VSEGQSIVFPLVFFLSFVSFLVAGIVYFRSGGEPEALQRRFLPRFYAYAMLFICSLILLVGGGLLLKAALSYDLGLEFSYRGQLVYVETRRPLPTPPAVTEEPEYETYWEPPPAESVEYRHEERVRDLLNGATLVGTGGLFLALHWLLRNRLEGREERPLSFLNRAYVMVSGVVYGGLCLVLIPTALHQLIEFYLVPRGDAETTIWSWPIPGDTLGYALVALALWLWAFPQLFRGLGLDKGAE